MHDQYEHNKTTSEVQIVADWLLEKFHLILDFCYSNLKWRLVLGQLVRFIISAVSFKTLVERAYMEMKYLKYLVVWIFLRSLGVICYDIWVLSEGHKNYCRYWYLELAACVLFLTYF